MPVILPPMGNLTIEILKGTALVSLIGLSDLTFEGTQAPDVNRRLNPDPPSVADPLLQRSSIIYFVLAQIINGVFRFAERRVNRRFQAAHQRDAVGTPSTPPAATTGWVDA